MLQKNKLLLLLMAIMTITSVHSAFAQANDDDEVINVQFLWLLDGIRNTYECGVPETDEGTTVATCHDHEIIDLRTNRIIGTATDATADVSAVDGGLVATGTTFFRLPQGNLTIRGRGTIQPMLEGNPMLDNSPVTHIAGIFPEPGANDVLGGTGAFEGAKGTFGLLGALDLTNAAQGQSKFHCVYLFNLQLKVSAIKRAKRTLQGLGALKFPLKSLTNLAN